MACVILVKLIIQPERLSDKQDTQSNNTPANQQVGNDQTPQITLFDGFSSLLDFLACTKSP